MNELQLTCQGASAPYAVLQDEAGRAWNGADFEAFSDARLALYALPLSARGGDLYGAAMPASFPVATAFRATFHDRAGATPSAGDLLLAARSLYWTGAALTDPPSSGASGSSSAGEAAPARSVYFSGPAGEVYSADNAAWTLKRPIMSGERAVRLLTWRVDSAEPAPIAGGPTVIAFDTLPPGDSGGDPAMLTLEEGAAYSAPAACTFDLAASQRPYVWVAEAGGHANIAVTFELAYLTASAETGAGAMTAEGPIAAAWGDVTGDDAVVYPASDAKWLRWLSDALGEAYALRPDLFLVGGAVARPGEVSARTEALPLGPEWRRALADYLLYRYYGTLDANQANRPAAEAKYKAWRLALGA